jgi:PAS domain S-box-containing protein
MPSASYASGSVLEISERKRVLRTLQAIDARFAAIARGSPLGIALSDPASDLVIDANPAGCACFGCEMVGRTCLSLDLWNSASHRDRMMAALKSGSSGMQDERQVRRASGEIVCVLVSVELLHIDGRVCLQWILLDVTELRQSKALASHSESVANAIMNSIDFAVAVLDRDGNIVRTNRKWSELAIEHGASDGMQIGKGANYFEICRRALPDLSAHEALDAMWAVLSGRQSVASVEYACHGPGRERWFLLQVTPLGDGSDGLVTIHIDITGRKEFERELCRRLELQERFARMAESLPGVVYSVRRHPDGRFSLPFASPQLKEIHGLDPSDVVDDFSTGMALTHPDDRALVMASTEESAERLTPWHCEFRLCVPGRGEIWVEGRSVPQREADGSILWHGFIHDISERKRADVELMASRDQLRALTERLQQVREEERTRIAREIHDQLGQNLTALKIDLTWLKRTLPSEFASEHEKLRALCCMIDDTVQAVRTISWDLRPSILDTIGLGAGIEWLADDFRLRLGIRCYVEVPDERLDLPEALATHLFRICQELLTNVARHAEASRVDIVLLHRSAEIMLEVSDNGCGMPSSLPERRSLGLLGVRERTAQCGGMVTIATVPEIEGTRVRILIPIKRVEGKT